MSDWNAEIIDEFRRNSGTAGGIFEGKPLLLLHHAGARTGTARVTPLMYLAGESCVYIFASKGGAPNHPDWYHNLKAHPAVLVEIGTETKKAFATELEGTERDGAFAKQAAEFPQFGEYQAGTDRVIPVFRLDL